MIKKNKQKKKASPVQRVVLHAQVVTRKVSRGVTKVVVLVPQHPLAAGGSRYDFHLDGQLDSGGYLTTHLRLPLGQGTEKKTDRLQLIRIDQLE